MDAVEEVLQGLVERGLVVGSVGYRYRQYIGTFSSMSGVVVWYELTLHCVW